MSIRTCWGPACTAEVFSTEIPVFHSEACRETWREQCQIVIDDTAPLARMQKVIAPAPAPIATPGALVDHAARQASFEAGRRQVVQLLVDAYIRVTAMLCERVFGANRSAR